MTKWVFIRAGEVGQVFNSRKDAIKYFKEMLTQTLKDFHNQDKSDEYDYRIHIPEMRFVPVVERRAEFSLI